jgi:hypothetical protein
VPIPAEDFREMRGESNDATAPEMQGFFVVRVFVRAALPGAGLSVSKENDVDEDE